jgi:hypothetical protein
VHHTPVLLIDEMNKEGPLALLQTLGTSGKVWGGKLDDLRHVIIVKKAG